MTTPPTTPETEVLEALERDILIAARELMVSARLALDPPAEDIRSGAYDHKAFVTERVEAVRRGVELASSIFIADHARLAEENERARAAGWRDAVSAVQYMAANWDQDRRAPEEKVALRDAAASIIDELISASPGDWLGTEWKSAEEWMSKVQAAEAARDKLSGEVERLKDVLAGQTAAFNAAANNHLAAEAKFAALHDAAKNAKMLFGVMLASPFWKDAIEGVRNAIEDADDKLRAALSASSTVPVEAQDLQGEVERPKADLERANTWGNERHADARKYMEMAYQLQYPPSPELLEHIAGRIDCGGNCDTAWREWDTNAAGCTLSETEGCPFEEATQLREFAKALRTQAALNPNPAAKP